MGITNEWALGHVYGSHEPADGYEAVKVVTLSANVAKEVNLAENAIYEIVSDGAVVYKLIDGYGESTSIAHSATPSNTDGYHTGHGESSVTLTSGTLLPANTIHHIETTSFFGPIVTGYTQTGNEPINNTPTHSADKVFRNWKIHVLSLISSGTPTIYLLKKLQRRK